MDFNFNGISLEMLKLSKQLSAAVTLQNQTSHLLSELSVRLERLSGLPGSMVETTDLKDDNLLDTINFQLESPDEEDQQTDQPTIKFGQYDILNLLLQKDHKKHELLSSIFDMIKIPINQTSERNRITSCLSTQLNQLSKKKFIKQRGGKGSPWAILKEGKAFLENLTNQQY